MKRNLFLGTVLTIVVALIIIALFSIDSPQISRLKKLDQQTQNHLYSLYSDMSYYHESNSSTLPENLTELRKGRYPIRVESSQHIKYTKISETDFELCAEFFLNSPEEQNSSYKYEGDLFSEYRVGEHCFELKTTLWK